LKKRKAKKAFKDTLMLLIEANEEVKSEKLKRKILSHLAFIIKNEDSLEVVIKNAR